MTTPSGRISNELERKREEREKNAIYSGHLRFCQQPRAAQRTHSARTNYTYSDQFQHVQMVVEVLLAAESSLRSDSQAFHQTSIQTYQEAVRNSTIPHKNVTGAITPLARA